MPAARRSGGSAGKSKRRPQSAVGAPSGRESPDMGELGSDSARSRVREELPSGQARLLKAGGRTHSVRDSLSILSDSTLPGSLACTSLASQGSPCGSRRRS